MAKTKGKKGSVKVEDMDAKSNPKGGETQKYLVVKLNDIIVTGVSSLPAVQDQTSKIK
jgi:hypothetical protein